MQERIVRYTSEELKKLPDLTDWDRVLNIKDEDIDFSDIPELDEEWFKTAKRPGLEQERKEKEMTKKAAENKDTIFITLKPKIVEKIKSHKSWKSMLKKEIEKLVAASVF